MAATLLDVNALIALIWPEHEFHLQAISWFERNARHGWATCPITQMGFVRVMSNTPSANAPDINEALRLLDLNLSHPNHEFWPDEIGLSPAIDRVDAKLQGHRQITDAYLLGLAMHHKGRLATFDRSIAALLPEGKRKTDWIVELSTQ
ncbi:MAG TPA: TA system VapC family ribonuclease toxin [Silvibacterium sp.]|nr:TA system VapC family ribonuclease toxin [Silvibacterium sp.]